MYQVLLFEYVYVFQLFAEDVRTAAADSVHDVAVQFHAVNENC